MTEQTQATGSDRKHEEDANVCEEQCTSDGFDRDDGFEDDGAM